MSISRLLKAPLWLLIVALLLAACSTPTPAVKVPTKKVEVEFIGWIIENLPADYSKASARLSTGIFFAEPELEQDKLTAADFESVRVTNTSGEYWLFEDSETFAEHFDEENRYLFLGKLYSSNFDNGSYVELGDYTLEVTLKDGGSIKETLFVPAPGSLEQEGSRYSYTENFSDLAAPPTGFMPMLKRPNKTAATLNETLSISFAIEDAMAYSGWVRLYNAEGKNVGYSGLFRTFKDGSMLSALNAGAYYTDGRLNTLELDFDSEDATLFEGFGKTDIAYARVFLTDGYQYTTEENRYGYDTMSVSERIYLSNP